MRSNEKNDKMAAILKGMWKLHRILGGNNPFSGLFLCEMKNTGKHFCLINMAKVGVSSGLNMSPQT